MTATATTPTRTVRWADMPAGGIIIAEGHKRDRYACREFDSPMGRAFHLEKLGPRGGAEHDVLLTDDPGQCRCDCPAHEFRGRCRHVDALRALLGTVAGPKRERRNTADLDGF